MMGRLIMVLLAFVGWATAARADDVSAAGRSVVRVVIIAFNEDGEVSDFGHGSGFAVAPNRIVTNAHVIEMAQQGKQVAIGVVPSEGAQAYRARILAVDPARDLALLELTEGSISPITLYGGALDDGAGVVALGYPGNVDLATARSAQDYITPLPPTRSVGTFSNVRPINGITLLLHTAPIARGNSGGPLVDQCGRVLGVNTLITRTENGDSTFAFAVAGRELTAFLQQAHQPFQSVATECVSMSDRLRQDEERAAAEDRARQAALAANDSRARDVRQRSLEQIGEIRETRLAIAILLFALAMIACGGGGIMLFKERQQPAKILGGAGAALLLGAIVAFVSRPSLTGADADGPPGNSVSTASAAPDRFAGRNVCHLVPERSRVTVSPPNDVTLDWTTTGCVNQRTQYARNGDVWTRVLVPSSEQAVSVLQFRPGNGEYVVTRYLLDAQTMTRVRALRRDVEVKTCTADSEGRTVLANQLRDINEILPHLPNERLVYSCSRQAATPAPAR
jgi:V8-like Glu-specific endopeptidase